MKRTIFLMLSLMLISATACAEIKGERIEYQQGDTTLEGYLVYDDAIEGKRPGVIVVHDWMGFGEYGNKRAEMLARLGYVALAVDIYGKGVRPQNTDEASEQATKYKQDRQLLRERVKAGLETLKQNPLVDTSRTAAIGYCFGGTTVLELARSGADVTGVVSFHGGLSSSASVGVQDIKSKVQVLHGADDPYVPPSEVAAFQKEMNDAKADWQMVYYSGAVHSFTRKDAGNDPSKGAAYNENADQRSWEAMKAFFNEIFGHQ
jgi:dienelactone hydrolase